MKRLYHKRFSKSLIMQHNSVASKRALNQQLGGWVLVVFIFYDFEKTVRKTGWSVRGFWVIIERFSRRSRENLEIITQKPRTDHPVFRTVCLRSLRMWNVLFLGSCFPSQVKKFFIAVKKTTHIQGKVILHHILMLMS